MSSSETLYLEGTWFENKYTGNFFFELSTAVEVFSFFLVVFINASKKKYSFPLKKNAEQKIKDLSIAKSEKKNE
jgi:hypothetical protein